MKKARGLKGDFLIFLSARYGKILRNSPDTGYRLYQFLAHSAEREMGSWHLAARPTAATAAIDLATSHQLL